MTDRKGGSWGFKILHICNIYILELHFCKQIGIETLLGLFLYLLSAVFVFVDQGTRPLGMVPALQGFERAFRPWPFLIGAL